MQANNRTSNTFRHLAVALALGQAALMVPAAQAADSTIIDFEAAGHPTVILGTVTYSEDGYRFASPYSFGVIGFANGDDPVAPTGNGTLYYSAVNGFSPDIARPDGRSFDLMSLDVALLPSTPDEVYGGELIFNNAHPDVSTGLVRFRLAPSATGHYAFTHIDNLGAITGFDGQLAFSNLTRLYMWGCLYNSAQATSCDPLSQAQLAFDNVELRVSAVPEVPGLALFSAGLVLLGPLVRRGRYSGRRRETASTLTKAARS